MTHKQPVFRDPPRFPEIVSQEELDAFDRHLDSVADAARGDDLEFSDVGRSARFPSGWWVVVPAFGAGFLLCATLIALAAWVAAGGL